MHSLSRRWAVLLAVLCSGGAFIGLMNMAGDPDIPGQSANASFQILQVASQFCEWWTPEPAVGTAVDGFGGDAGFLPRWGSSDEGSPDVPSAGSSRLLGLGISAAAAQRAADAAAGDRKANFLVMSTASLQLALLLDAAQQAGLTLWWAAWSTEEQGDAFDAQQEHVAGYVHLHAQTIIWDSPSLSSWAEPFLFDNVYSLENHFHSASLVRDLFFCEPLYRGQLLRSGPHRMIPGHHSLDGLLNLSSEPHRYRRLFH